MSGDNRLPILAAQVRCAAADIAAATAAMAEKAIEAGHALVEAKSLIGHGGWLPFLVEAGVHERTAQRYMELARSNLTSDTVSLLGGVTAALRFLHLRENGVQLFAQAKRDLVAIDVSEADEAEALEKVCTALAGVMNVCDEMVAMFPPEASGPAMMAEAGSEELGAADVQ
jgi:hypothetical protein